jgi:hypothetical protein
MVVAPGVVLTRESRTPPWRGTRAALLDAAALGLATVLLVGAAVLAPAWYLAAALVVVGCEGLLAWRPNLPSFLADLSQAGPFWRGGMRGASACLLVGAHGDLDTGLGPGLVWAGLTWLAIQLSGAAARAGLELTAYLRRSPVLTRNVDLSSLALPAPPPGAVTARGGLVTGLLDVPLVVGAGVAVDLGAGWALPVGAVGSLAGAAAVLGTIALAVLRLRRRDPRSRVPALVQQSLADLRPAVLLYFAGRPSTLYQVEMWLEVAERLPRRTVVVLRDRDSLLRLAPTSLPVVCVPSAAAFASLELPTARAVLMPANAAENIHVLRRRNLTSVFIGHGDSDKVYSANPFVRAYDEVWVAGPAGRDRFVEAQVDLPDGAVVEVGRPQVALTRPRSRTDSTFTVLYAPTWEGWGDVAFHTSVPHVGVAMIEALLARPGVRVLYRPHPLTGSRDAGTRTAHRRIVGLLTRAGARLSSDRPERSGTGRPGLARPGAGRAGSGPAGGTDPLAHSVATGRAGFDRAAHDAAEQARERAWWDAVPAGSHHVVDDGWPDVRSCFDEADLLVTDVSSVISDWLATDRPYAVLNASPDPGWQFAEQYPSVRGGRVVGPGLAELWPLVEELRGGGDPEAAARRTERTRLLGADPERSLDRFAAAVDRICARDCLVPTRKDG